MEKRLNNFLTVGEIIEAAGIEGELTQQQELRSETCRLKEAAGLSRDKHKQMEDEIERLNSEIADGLINGQTVDEIVMRRSMLREGLGDLKAIPGRIEIQAKELDRKGKQIETAIFHKLTAVLKIEREKRANDLKNVITDHCEDWFSVTRGLSKNFSGGVIPPGWSSLREDIHKLLDSLYSSTGASFRG